jgi:hypothetical protein
LQAVRESEGEDAGEEILHDVFAGSKAEGKAMSTHWQWLAVDPGVSGGIAWHDGEDFRCQKMPGTDGDILLCLRNLASAGVRKMVMEQPATAIFGAGHSSLAVLHRNVGFLQGAAMALGFELYLVPPKRWQKTIGFQKRPGEEQRSWKNRLKGEAQRRFPRLSITLSTADAVLILAAQLSLERQ